MEPFEDKNQIIKIMATSEEITAVKSLAGGEREVANYIRRLIKEDALKRGIELPEHVFAQRKGGNWLPKLRGKENRQPLTAINALAV